MIDREPYLPELDRRPAALPGRHGPAAGGLLPDGRAEPEVRPAAQAQ
jgi:hypothetical protein